MRHVLFALAPMVAVLFSVVPLQAQCEPVSSTVMSTMLVGCPNLFKRVEWNVRFPDYAVVNGISQGHGDCDTTWDCPPPPNKNLKSIECWPLFESPTTRPGVWSQVVRNQTAACATIPCMTGGWQRGCECRDDGDPVEWEVPHTCGPADNDGDSYFEGVDCDDDNPNINPGASEVCGNNKDDDCDGNIDGIVNCPPDFIPPEGCDCITPIILELDRGQIRLTDAKNGVLFDWAGDGRLIQTSWTAGGNESAFLVLDINGNGRIDNGTELFGNHSSFPKRQSFKNGFEVLRYLDTPAMGGNFDGVIDSRDEVYSWLLLWVDRNHNGYAEPDELLKLSGHISSIEWDYKVSNHRDRFGNLFRWRGKIHFKDGKIRYAYDVVLMPLK